MGSWIASLRKRWAAKREVVDLLHRGPQTGYRLLFYGIPCASCRRGAEQRYSFATAPKLPLDGCEADPPCRGQFVTRHEL